MSRLLISVDTEASGPCPLRGDIISFGAVVIEPGLTRCYRSRDMRPTVDAYDPAAYRVVGVTREEHEAFTHTMDECFRHFNAWLEELDSDRLIMVSDNPGFDFQWMNFGFMTTIGSNPLGHSARRIGDMWSGLRRREHETLGWKKLRITAHTHDPLEDALGNAEAYLRMWDYEVGYEEAQAFYGR
ncbi:3'-5' exonuclease family protein [Flavisphingomonas formosensis]|uniref:exonuclease n=1 Tax=Flavisphingomonas formosensis TaxID=861534 RepID=UPI0012F88696|nr:exonuclease [Sphingomonas formosensis]